MFVRIPAAVLHSSRFHVLRVAFSERELPRPGEKRFACALLREQGFGFRRVTSLSLPREARKLEVVLPRLSQLSNRHASSFPHGTCASQRQGSSGTCLACRDETGASGGGRRQGFDRC